MLDELFGSSHLGKAAPAHSHGRVLLSVATYLFGISQAY